MNNDKGWHTPEIINCLAKSTFFMCSVKSLKMLISVSMLNEGLYGSYRVQSII